MNIWELVTSSSTLPIAPANSFWDHLNNLGAGGGGLGAIYGEIEVELMADIEVFLENEYDVEIEAEFDVTLESEYVVEVC